MMNFHVKILGLISIELNFDIQHQYIFWFVYHHYQSVCISKCFGCNCVRAKFFCVYHCIKFLYVLFKNQTHLSAPEEQNLVISIATRYFITAPGLCCSKNFGPLKEILAAPLIMLCFSVHGRIENAFTSCLFVQFMADRKLRLHHAHLSSSQPIKNCVYIMPTKCPSYSCSQNQTKNQVEINILSW